MSMPHVDVEACALGVRGPCQHTGGDYLANWRAYFAFGNYNADAPHAPATPQLKPLSLCGHTASMGACLNHSWSSPPLYMSTCVSYFFWGMAGVPYCFSGAGDAPDPSSAKLSLLRPRLASLEKPAAWWQPFRQPK